MPSMDRRRFLLRTGMAMGAVLLAGRLPSTASSATFEDWQSVRAQFSLAPALIHLAAFFLASHPAPVRQAIERHRAGFDADPIGYWSEHEHKQEAVVLRAAADYLGATPAEIALTDSTTMGLGLLYGGLRLRGGQEILTTVHDHYSTDMSLRLRAERTGAAIRRIVLYEDATRVSRDELSERLLAAVGPQTRVVAVTWVHSSTGVKLPIQDMARRLAEVNRQRVEEDRVIFCVDGVHALGVEDFQVDELGCDFLIAGTHKWLFGPRGTGLIWGHPRAWPLGQPIIPTFNSDAFEMWTAHQPSTPLPQSIYMTPGGFHSFEHRWALDAAFSFHKAIGRPRVTQRIHTLNRQLKEGLAPMRHVTLRTPMSQDVSAGIVCFEVAGYTPRQAVARLRELGIVASVTPYATEYARLAPSLLNSPEEIEKTLAIISGLH